MTFREYVPSPDGDFVNVWHGSRPEAGMPYVVIECQWKGGALPERHIYSWRKASDGAEGDGKAGSDAPAN